MSKAKLEVTVHPQIELLMTVLLTSNYATICESFLGYSIMTEEQTDYVKSIMNHFGHYSDHPIYELLDEMIPKGFALGAPVDAVLSLGTPPWLEKQRSFSSFAIQRACGEEKLDEFVSLLRDFADVSGYMEFLEENQDHYADALQLFRSGVNRKPYVQILEDFYGLEQEWYYIHLTQLSKGSFGFSSDFGSGKLRLYNVCGFNYGLLEDAEAFDRFLNNILWHEFSHPIINPLTQLHAGSIKNPDQNFSVLQAYKHPHAGYGPWDECINEHIIRAVSIYLCRQHVSEALANERLDYEVKLGYLFIPHVLNALATYDQNRDLYPSIDDFYETLLQVFVPSNLPSTK